MNDEPAAASDSGTSFEELDSDTRSRLWRGKEPETRHEAVAALGEVDRQRALPWWRSSAAIEAVVWLVAWPAGAVLIRGEPLSLVVVLTGAVPPAAAVFAVGSWLSRRRTNRMERQAKATLSRLDSLDQERR